MKIRNESDNDLFQIVIDHPILDRVEFYDSDGLLDFISEMEPFYKRTYEDPNLIFDIPIKAGESKEFYLKIKSSELIVLPVSLGTPDKILSISSLKEMLFGIYAGIILVMFLYNIFVYFSVRDRSYLYYVVYILFIGLTQASLKGFTFKYVWPEYESLNLYSVTILSSIAGIAAIEFLKDFLHTREFDPKLHKVSYVVNGLFILSSMLCLFGLYQNSFSLMQLTTMLGSIYAFVIAVRIFRTGFRPAKFFLIA